MPPWRNSLQYRMHVALQHAWRSVDSRSPTSDPRSYPCGPRRRTMQPAPAACIPLPHLPPPAPAIADQAAARHPQLHDTPTAARARVICMCLPAHVSLSHHTRPLPGPPAPAPATRHGHYSSIKIPKRTYATPARPTHALLAPYRRCAAHLRAMTAAYCLPTSRLETTLGPRASQPRPQKLDEWVLKSA